MTFNWNPSVTLFSLNRVWCRYGITSVDLSSSLINCISPIRFFPTGSWGRSPRRCRWYSCCRDPCGRGWGSCWGRAGRCSCGREGSGRCSSSPGGRGRETQERWERDSSKGTIETRQLNENHSPVTTKYSRCTPYKNSWNYAPRKQSPLDQKPLEIHKT